MILNDSRKYFCIPPGKKSTAKHWHILSRIKLPDQSSPDPWSYPWSFNRLDAQLPSGQAENWTVNE